MKIDIYTLLGMIKDGKAPKKIMYENEVLYYDDKYPETYNYYDEEGNNQLFDGNIGKILNDEVEILETTITYSQDNYYQYQPYTREVEIKCNSAKNLLESDKIYNQDKIEKINKIRINYNSINIDKAFETGTTTFFREKDIEIFQCLSSKINEIIDRLNNK